MSGDAAGWANPLVRVNAALLLLSASWFVVNLVVPIGPVILMWLPMPVCIALTTASCWRASIAAAGVPKAAARFWRHIAVTMVLLTASTAKEIQDAFSNDFEPLVVPSHATMVGYCLTVLMFVVALFRLPLGERSRAEQVTFWFDVGTVMLAAAVFLWHFTTRGLMLQRAPVMGPAELAATAALMVLELTGVFAVTKVALTGSQSLERRSMRFLTGALLVPCVSSSLEQLLANTQLRMTTLAVPLVCLLLALGAECQRAAALTTEPGAGAVSRLTRRRRYSRLPYLAVAATDVLLLVVTSGSSPQSGSSSPRWRSALPGSSLPGSDRFRRERATTHPTRRWPAGVGPARAAVSVASAELVRRHRDH